VDILGEIPYIKSGRAEEAARHVDWDAVIARLERAPRGEVRTHGT
jgi:hypothetical protein